MRIEGVVLAAGQGTRMVSKRPKVLHGILGLPMVVYVVRALRGRTEGMWVVTGHRGEDVEGRLGNLGLSFVRQDSQRGTGDALRVVLSHLSAPWVLVAPGDMPLLRGGSLDSMIEYHARGGLDVTVLTTTLEDPAGYGRILREGDLIKAIVEDSEAGPREREVREVNTGVYLFSLDILKKALPLLSPHPPKGEYYLPDVVSWGVREGYKVGAWQVGDPQEGLGVNSRAQLAVAWSVLRDRKNKALMEAGVTLVEPSSVYVDVDVDVGWDTMVYPWVQLQGKTSIGEGCVIFSHVRILDSRLGAGTVVLDSSLVEGAVLEGGVRVGPMARLRPGTWLDRGVKIGNFVEVKKSHVGEGSKASHLSYIGDATLGKGVNVGAGTITCNYDGFAKHPTIVGDGVFIGSDTQLVAPLKVGSQALIGAGSTITKDVPENALALSRAHQKVIPGKGMDYYRKRRGG